MSDTSFSVESLLSDDSFPYSHTFHTMPFKRLTLNFRTPPQDSFEIIEEAVGERLKALGFNPRVTVLHLVGQVPLTGQEFTEYEDAYDRLTAEKRVELGEVLMEGLHAVVVKTVGSWNSKDSLDLLPALLKKYPEMTRAIFELASGVKLSTDETAGAKR